MDDQFDRLSRAMADPLGRRHALKLLAAGAAAIGAAALGLRPASAQEGCTCQEAHPDSGSQGVFCKNSQGFYCGSDRDPCEEACAGKALGDPCSC